MATHQPSTKRDVGGQGDKTQAKDANPAKNKPGKPAQGGGSKGKNDSGGNR